jgi:hypothetical protein
LLFISITRSETFSSPASTSARQSQVKCSVQKFVAQL